MMRLGEDDIIAAIATPLGESAIAIIRISGKGSIDLVRDIFRPKSKDTLMDEIQSHKMTLGYIVNRDGRILDEVLVCIMRAPKTYTREDLVEIHCHGGIVSVNGIFELVLKMGARMAEPGEFTKRAFLNGRIDLAQAEAVLDLIRAKSQKGIDLAIKQLSGALSEFVQSLRREMESLIARMEAEIDFPEDVEESDRSVIVRGLEDIVRKIEEIIETEDVGRVYREGLATVLIGKPNVGKSTLLNRMIGSERAIVTDIPGTTRDIIEETVSIRGIPVRMIDTAGIRKNAGVVERIGIEKAREELEKADIALAVIDITSEMDEDDLIVAQMIKEKRGIVVLNKMDVGYRKADRKEIIGAVGEKPVVEISAAKGWGIEDLKSAIVNLVIQKKIRREDAMITRKRYKDAMIRARDCLVAAAKALDEGMPVECAVIDLWEAWKNLGEITGETLNDEIINRIFEEFCVGK